MRWMWIGLTGALVALVGCGGGGSQGTASAGDAVKQQFGFVINGQWGREWEQLHPAQQAIASKDAFIACNARVSIPLDRVDVVEEYDETVTVPELGSVPTRAVTVRLTRGSQSQNMTVHEIKSGSSWRWVLDQPSIDAYRGGSCPA